MKPTALLLPLLLSIGSTWQTCAAGCLKCDSSGNCLVPDLSAGYVLNNNAAVQNAVAFCLLLGPDGMCAACTANYFLDATTSKCVAVPSASLINNCSLYNSAASCSLCAAGFYLNNNACTAVTTAVTYCAAYSSATVCASCFTGYILSADNTSCVSIASMQNCSGYSFVTCSSCAAGYHLNRNAYLTNTLQAGASTQNSVLALFARNLIQDVAYTGLTVCQSNAAFNCGVYVTDTNTCTACNSGYYLDKSGICNVFPAEGITGCLVYSSAITCSACMNGRTLSNNICTIIPVANLVPFCLTYDGTASTVRCTACDASHYLPINSNSCTARVDSLNINYCATLSLSEDKCATCATDFILSSDSQQCYSMINNCAVLATVPKNSTIQCTTCANTYYLTAASGNVQSKCTLGPITNCVTYSNPTTCSSCAQNYFLANSNTSCVHQPDITDCTAYSAAAGMCATCNPANSFLVVQTQSCQALTGTPINHCVTHGPNLTSPTCTKCEDGFYPDNNSTICSIITTPNCLTASSSTVCTKCGPGLYLSYNSSACVAAFTAVSSNCYKDNTGTDGNMSITSQSCLTCNQGAFPISNAGQYSCVSLVESAQLNSGTQYNPAASVAAGACLKFDSSFNCVQCDPGATNQYLVPGSPATCAATCGVGVPIRKYTIDSTTFQIKQVNVCNAVATTDNCEVYAPDVSDPALPDICIKCVANVYPVVYTSEADRDRHGNVTPTGNASPSAVFLGNYFIVPFKRYPKLQCYLPNGLNSKLINFTITDYQPIAGCDLYFFVEADNLSCARCVTGSVGRPSLVSGKVFITSCRNTSTVTYDSGRTNLEVKFEKFINAWGCPSINGYFLNLPVFVYKQKAQDDPNFDQMATFTFSNNNFDYSWPGDLNILCAPINKLNTNGNTAMNTWGFYDNGSFIGYNRCAIAAVGGNNGVVDSANPYANFCLACLAGYKATVDPQYTFVKKSCTPIPNCQPGGDMYNGCSLCSLNYILNYTSSNVDFETCVSVPSQTASRFDNCYAAESASLVATKCKVCNTGFAINGDGICQAIQPANCVTNGFVKVDTNGSLAALGWYHYINKNATGCNRCSVGYIAVDISSSASNICVTANYEANVVDTLNIANTPTVYKQNCKYYVNSTSTIACAVCQTGYVLSTAGGCLVNTSLADCAIASSLTVCSTCTDNTYSLSQTGVCVIGHLSDCATYNYDTPSPNGNNHVCTACRSGYYLNSSGVCTLGTILNCLTYSNSELRCVACAANFSKINNAANSNQSLADLCIPAATNNGCGVFTVNTSGSYSCTQCTNNTTQTLAAIPVNGANSLCLAFSQVSHCATYNSGAITTASFSCATCSFGYYLASLNTCVAVTNVNHCATYAVSADRCLGCQTGFYFTATSTCVAVTNVSSCTAYSSTADICQACASGFYLTVTGACAKITKVSKCTAYSINADACQACSPGYFLSSNGSSCTIYPTGIAKCVTYTSASTCSACKPGYYLDSNACVAVTSPINGCSTYSAANTCSGCNTGFFLSNNTCTQATALNCLTYSSINTCASCSNGFVLQATTSNSTSNGVTTIVTTTSCVAATNKPNCATIDYNPPNNCLSCSGINYLNNGACSAANSIAQCAVYASATTCAQCNAGFALSTDAQLCISNANMAAYIDANCANSQLVTAPMCSRCGAGSYFVNGSCSGTCGVAGCLACDPANNTKCSVCNSTYYHDESGNCIANSLRVDTISAKIFGSLSALMFGFLIILYK